MHSRIPDDPPLAALRVVDLSHGPARHIGRQLAELGATVMAVEADSGDRAEDLVANRGKRALGGGNDALEQALSDADLVIAGREFLPDVAAATNFAAAHPHLVVLSVTGFGLTKELAGWRGSEAVYQALGGQLSRSGIPGREPLLAPGGIATRSATSQACFVSLLACLDGLATGRGQLIDFAMVEGAAQALDPGFGIQGSATSGTPASKLPRGRPEARFQYPILPCRDGFARICVLAPRQWAGMFEWLGRPEEFADPSFANLITRYQSTTLIPAIAHLFADKTRAEIEAEAVRFGVPAAGLATLDEAIANEHFTARQSLEPVTLSSSETVRMVAPAITIGGLPERPDAPSLNWQTEGTTRPLEGLRVLDFGVIVVGAEAGRLLADYGADVIKVENPGFPDGSRQTRKGDAISPGFAAGHRNKRSLAIDLRNPQGREYLLTLAAKSDVILSNFKPGTMESLVLGAEALLSVNPKLVIVESSAFGSTGPWSDRGGYGPLVRAAAGLTYLWRYTDDPLGFSDALTVYPDHVAGRMSAIAALALLMRRNCKGRGGHAGISQAEVMLSHLATRIVRNDLAEDDPNAAFVIACAGDDEWCVVELENAHDRLQLAQLLGLEAVPDDLALRSALAARFATLSPMEAAELLQASGLPAAPMLRVPEMPDFPYFAERAFLRPLRHPLLDGGYVIECAPVHLSNLPTSPDRPAPLMGEHSVEIARELLGLGEAEIARLLDTNVLFQPAGREAPSSLETDRATVP